MVLIGRRLSADDLRAVNEDPEAVATLLFGDLDDDDAGMPDPDLDVDKSWHGLHFLLTGTAWDVVEGAGEAILGGEEIGEDNGYGPARLISAETVGAVAAALDAVDMTMLRARFDPRAMAAADIYPEIWNGSDVFDSYLAPNFAALREFYRTAATNGQAVLLALT